jgi:hypothetical protein
MRHQDHLGGCISITILVSDVRRFEFCILLTSFPLRFGPDWAWNNFDFFVVAIIWIPRKFMPLNVMCVRVLRLIRLLKLAKQFKQLRVVVMGMLNGFKSVGYIVLLLLLFFFVFAVFGCMSFRRNDPFHWGGLGISMVTLYRVATFENWTQIIYLSYFGCNSQYTSLIGVSTRLFVRFCRLMHFCMNSLYLSQVYFGGNGRNPWVELGQKNQRIETPYGSFYERVCWHPHRQAALSSVYFIVFVFVVAFVVFSVFIGAVTGAMAEAVFNFKDQEKMERDIKSRKRAKLEDPK